MIRHVLLILAWLTCTPLFAGDIAIAAHNIQPGDVIAKDDIMFMRGDAAGAFQSAEALIGAQAQVALYAGRVILARDIAPPNRIQRNQIIEITFVSNALTMTTEGRALGQGAVGQRIRVMNLSSKTPIFGTIQSDGSVRVSK